MGNSQASKHKEVQGGLVLRRVGKTDVVGAPYRDVISAIQAQPERPLMMSFSGVGLSKEQVRACNVSEFPNHARLIFTCMLCGRMRVLHVRIFTRTRIDHRCRKQ